MHKFNWLTERPIAHRGYHDLNRNVWENALSAFARAVDAGFAIECDLQYAADAIPVVFHDDDLKRLCGIEGDVRQRTAGELGLLKVGGTADKIPTLRQLLDLVKGRVPIVLELKGRKGDDDGFAHQSALLNGIGGGHQGSARRAGPDGTRNAAKPGPDWRLPSVR